MSEKLHAAKILNIMLKCNLLHTSPFNGIGYWESSQLYFIYETNYNVWLLVSLLLSNKAQWYLLPMHKNITYSSQIILIVCTSFAWYLPIVY